MVAVSVVVATTDPGERLLGLVRSLDAQTLPARDFEVVVADASVDGSAERLRDFAERRANVVVVAAEPGTPEAALVRLARERATGDRVVVLAQDRRLAPRALELLLGRAASSASGTVVGRVADGAGSGSARLPDDADRAEPGVIDPATSILLEPRVPDAPGTVAVIGRYACAVGEGEPPGPVDGPALSSVAIGWEAGRLQVDAEVRDAPADARAWLVAAREGVDLALPATLEADGSLAASLDPGRAEAGGALADGLWDLRLRVTWSDGETTLPVPAGPRLAAVVDGRPSVVRPGADGAQLDVGATRGEVTGPAPQETASVVESVRGILLVLEQPTVHVHGDADLDARLLLGGFPLRARLVCRDGAARVEALASSLAGTSALGIAVGGGQPVPTGLRLRVDGVGAMTVEVVPPPKPEPPPAPAGPPPLVQRLRRLAPTPLEPVVRRLSRVPVLRDAYRVLLTR
jgi:hypothetical protein